MKNGEQWICVSDLMSGLMMIFLFVCIALLVGEQKQNKFIKEKLDETEKLSKKIYKDLNNEFKKRF